MLLRHGLLHSDCQTPKPRQVSLSFIFKQLEMTICDRVEALSKFFSTWAGKITWFDFFEIYPDPALSLGTPFEGNIFSWKGGRGIPINL